MRGLRALAWLACVAASANGPPKRNAVAKSAAEQTAGATTAREVAARNVAAEMIKSKLATQTTRPAFEQGHRRLQVDPCETYAVSGSEHQTWSHGTYVANGKCEGRTLYECVGCTSLNIEYLWYNIESERWFIGDDGCGTTIAGIRSPGGTFVNPGLVTQWTEYAWRFEGWVETSTISVRCLDCDDVNPGTFTADDETVKEAVKLWFDDRCKAIETYGHISTWETGGVTDMSYLFCGNQYDTTNCNAAAASFNEDIGAWDTSGVTTMEAMFDGASSFNQPLSDWRVEKVTDMREMFLNAESFNQPLSDWQVDKVTSMVSMFEDAKKFNQPIGNWRVDNVVNMGAMFYLASSFDHPLDAWRIDKVKNMRDMFRDASAFNQALGWCVRDDVTIEQTFDESPCEPLSCGVVQGICPDPEAIAGDYCKLSDPELCSGSRASFVEAPSNPFADIENRYAVPTLADVDGDGNNDLLVGREDGTIALYRHAGAEFQHDEDPFKSVAVDGHATPALVDLDGDGLLELVVGAQGGGLAFYANAGTETAPVFTKVSDAVPPCGDKLLGVSASECPAEQTLRGLLHCDSVACGELCQGDGECGTSDSLDNCGVTNIIGEESCENYNRCDVYLKTCDARPGPFGSVTLAMTHTAPAFADLDGDGLVDLVIGKKTAGALTYYKNVGSPTAADFQLISDGPFANVRVGRFSKPMFYDIDNDGDKDLIVGDDVGDVLLFLNVGSRFAPEFATIGIPFAGVFRAYATPTLGVLNAVTSLVVGTAPGQLVVYGEAPIRLEFARTKNSPFDGIDVGDESKPIFADLDSDGDLDLVVGVGGLGDESGKLFYYRNVGTPSQPNFEKVEKESLFDGINVGRRSTPTFADLDNDGDLDLVVGEYYGKLRYYRNVGTASQPSFEKMGCKDDLTTTGRNGKACSSWTGVCSGFDDDDFTASEQCCACGGGASESPFHGIDVNGDKSYGISAPTFADVDGDGDPDLVVGDFYGGLSYYRNVGTPSQPSFERVGCVDVVTSTDSEGYGCRRYDGRSSDCGRYDNEDFTASECCACGGGITTEESPFDGINVGRNSAPTFVDLDGDGLLDLVVGAKGGVINYWRNVGTPSQPAFEKVDDKSPFESIDVGGGESAPAFVDLDDDGDLDLIVGDRTGRLSYFENAGACRKTGEDGACSGNGICGELIDTVATCGCLFTFEDAQCDACRAGSYGTDCVNCPGSTWSKPGVRQTCDECRIGFYRANSTCVSCGEDKVCETTDVTLDNFECIAGTYRDGDDCEPCKHGMKCETQGVTLQNVRLEHDKWRTSENSDKIETCPLDSACRSMNETQTRRRLDESQDDEYDAGENLCASGYHGPLCAVCRNHHYRSGNECKKCSRGSEALNIILACVVFVGFVVAAALSIIYSQNFLKKSMDYFKKGEEAVDGLADNAEATEAIWRIVKTAIKQMLGMWSVVSNTPWILDVTYPKIFDKVLAFLSNVFSFDFTIAADCAVNRMGFKDTLLLNTLVPFVLCALIALLALVVARWPRKKMAREQDGVQKQSVQYAFNIILFIVFLSYTTASTTIFRALRPCHKFDEAYHGSNKYMKDDYGTSCRSNRHDFIRVYAWIMLFIYPIGVPLLTFVFLWRHRETLNPDVRVTLENRDLGGRADGAQKKSVGSCTDISLRRSCHALLGRSSDAHGHFDDVQREIVDAKIARRGELIKNMQKGRGFLERPELFAFMYDNYEPEYWWFECFDYIRRLLLTGILVVFEPGSATQGLFGVLVALFGTQVYSWTRPFPENAGDRLAESAQWSTFFTFLAALMILVNVNAANSTDQTIFGVLLIVIQFMPIAIGVGVGALNKNPKVKGKAQGLDKEAKGPGDKISSEEPTSEHRSSDATAGVKGRDEADEEQPATSDTN